MADNRGDLPYTLVRPGRRVNLDLFAGAFSAFFRWSTSTNKMKSIAIPVVLALSLAAISPRAFATVINFGPTNQNITFTGSGLNLQGQPQGLITWGSCAFDGSKTTCTVTAPFTGIGAGGTYSAVLVYSGNGPSSMIGTFQDQVSNLILISLGPSTVSFVQTLTETNGPTVNFYYATFQSLLTFPQSQCVGASPCSVLQVAMTPKATITGPVAASSRPDAVHPDLAGRDQRRPVRRVYLDRTRNLDGDLRHQPGYGIESHLGGSDFVGTQAPNTLAGTTVTVGGKNAFIDYVTASQVNAQVPSDVGTGLQPVVVTTAGGTSAAYMVNVKSLEPGLLAPTAFNVGAGQYVAALLPDGVTFILPPGLTSAVPTTRAKPGQTILLYGIGFGPVTPTISAGQIEEQASTLQSPFQISFAGVPAQIAYQGLVATFVGLYQFNVVVPDVAASDTVPLTFSVGTTGGTQALIIPVN